MDNRVFVLLIFDGFIDIGLFFLVEVYSFCYIVHILYLQAHFAFITATGIFYAALV